MTDAIIQDTPKNANPNLNTDSAFDSSIKGEEGSSGELSVNDIILGAVTENDETASAFTEKESGTPEEPSTGQPSQIESQTQSQPPVPGTDPKTAPNRYQHWQSQADRFENKLKKQQEVIDKLQSENNVANQEAPVAKPAVVEEFPPPPPRPQKPRNFTREEAYTDSSSESAKYLDDIEGWRDTMDEYNSLRTQYETAKVHEKVEAIESERVAEVQRNEAYQKQMQQVQQVTTHLKEKHGFDDATAQDFLSKMSSPDSLTMDNLVELYKMKGGGSQTSTPEAGPVAQPADIFNQAQRAQQVPSPMGVMPSSGSTDSRTAEDQVMDSMLTDLDNTNPWK